MAPKKKQTRKGGEGSQNSDWDLEEELKFRLYWKKVLLAIYNDELSIEKEWERSDAITKNNAKKLGISQVELIHALYYLENNGLIESRHGSPWMELTEKGFDVAGKIEERKETRLYRLSSLMFSGLLALTLVTTLIYQMDLVDPRLLLIAYIIAAVLLWIGILKLSQRKPSREAIRP